MDRVKRPYRSLARAAQAARTRGAIVDAAASLLTEPGLGRVTIAAIAERAGVAEQTVYATFGSKGAVLVALLDRLERDAEPERLAAAVEGDLPARDQLGEIVAFHRRLFERGATVIAATLGATSVDPDIADHVATGDRRRRESLGRAIRRWHARGDLRDDVTIAEAVDIAWTLTSPQLYLLLVEGSGWSPARYARWLTDFLASRLLR